MPQWFFPCSQNRRLKHAAAMAAHRAKARVLNVRLIVKLPFWNVEPEWAGETVAILGGGPSLTPWQAEACRGACRVIAVNTSYWLAPWADLLYFSDEVWWCWHHGGMETRTGNGGIAQAIRHPGAPRYHTFGGRKVALSNASTFRREPAVRILQNYEAQPGLCEIRDGVYTGR